MYIILCIIIPIINRGGKMRKNFKIIIMGMVVLSALSFTACKSVGRKMPLLQRLLKQKAVLMKLQRKRKIIPEKLHLL